MVVIKRLGTGSLVFCLVLWTPLMAIYAAIAASSTVPTFFPIVLIIGTVIGAFALASRIYMLTMLKVKRHKHKE